MAVKSETRSDNYVQVSTIEEFESLNHPLLFIDCDGDVVLSSEDGDYLTVLDSEHTYYIGQQIEYAASLENGPLTIFNGSVTITAGE